MTVQIDDDFLKEMGLENASEAQKREFVEKTLETLEGRVGTRLAESLTDEQLDEFESLVPADEDSPEVVAHKRAQMSQWLQEHHPNQRQVVTEEFEKLRHELKASLSAVFNQNAT